MILRHLFPLVLLTSAAALPAGVVGAAAREQKQESAETVGNGRWELFLDDHVLARSTGFRRVLHHPRARGVVIPADRPWETVGVCPLYVARRPDGSFVAFYRAIWWTEMPEAPEGKERPTYRAAAMAYATSSDGIHWEKPNLGLMEAPAAIDWERIGPYPTPRGTSKENNLGVPFGAICDLGQYGNVADPARRYAIELERIAADVERQLKPGQIYFAGEIPDFLGDPEWTKKLVDSGGRRSPRAALHFWDDVHQEWVGMSQGVIGHWLPSREIARFASKDLREWTARSVLYPDTADCTDPRRFGEAYGLRPFYTEGVVIGLLSWFYSDRTHPEGGGPLTKVSPEHPLHLLTLSCQKGTMGLRIALSRDGGLSWDRTVSREDWIPYGPEQDSCDRMVMCGAPPVRVGDEDWFYCTVVNGDHLGARRNNEKQTPYYHGRLPLHQAALYVQKHNRYVSLQAGNLPQVLITRPIEVSGKSLQLNVDAGHGEVRVGIARDKQLTLYGNVAVDAPHLLLRDRSEQTHLEPGFTLDDCLPVRADDVEHTVRFKGEGEVASFEGEMVRLFFQVEDADLYGFRFN